MNIVAISGSPSAQSRTAMLTDMALRMLGKPDAKHIRLADLDPAALVSANTSHPSIAAAAAEIEKADGVILATPVYKASCSGLTKIFLDLLPQFGLAGKAILPLATGGSLAHVLALDYALRPILQSMGARHIIQGVFVSNGQSTVADGTMTLAPESQAMLEEAVLHFRHALAPGNDLSPLLGHPRPERSVA
jgi:FMN reductase